MAEVYLHGNRVHFVCSPVVVELPIFVHLWVRLNQQIVFPFRFNKMSILFLFTHQVPWLFYITTPTQLIYIYIYICTESLSVYYSLHHIVHPFSVLSIPTEKDEGINLPKSLLIDPTKRTIDEGRPWDNTTFCDLPEGFHRRKMPLLAHPQIHEEMNPHSII